VLKQRLGIGDHLIFLLDLRARSILEELSLRVVPPPGRTLRADVHAYTSKYNTIPEQLVGRHRMFEKLTDIMGIPAVALGEYDIKMNKMNDEVKDFMLLAEKKCRTYKDNQTEWCPTINMWPRRRCVITTLHKFIAKTNELSLCS
jgi:hypothetical protein